MRRTLAMIYIMVAIGTAIANMSPTAMAKRTPSIYSEFVVQEEEPETDISEEDEKAEVDEMLSEEAELVVQEELADDISEELEYIEVNESQPEEDSELVDQEEAESIEPLSDEDLELVALVTVAEAEGEYEYGKRLVIDTIFNRVDSDKFPDTIYDVIYQKNQFSAMWNGRVKRCVVTDEIRQLVREEWESRTNYDVIFFRTGHFSSYGSPLFKAGNHYFSSYD